MRILILGAFNKEIESIINRFKESSPIVEKHVSNYKCYRFNTSEHKILISLTTVGTTPAAQITSVLSNKFNPDLIMMCGTAGGLQGSIDVEAQELQVGDVVISEKVIYVDQYHLFQLLPTMPAYAECAQNPHTGTQITHVYKSPEVLVNAAKCLSQIPTVSGNIGITNIFPVLKDHLPTIYELKCKVMEMESSGVFYVAEMMGIPALTIRAVSNLITEDGNDLGTTQESVQLCASRLADFMSAFLSCAELTKALDQIKSQRTDDQFNHDFELKKLPIEGSYSNHRQSSRLAARPIGRGPLKSRVKLT